MNYLFFDTETTGFPLNDVAPRAIGQARIIQLAAVLLDNNLKERACFSTLIKPEGWEVQPGAQSVHGISTEDCEDYGIPIDDALRVFQRMEAQAGVRIAHNISFDNRMLGLELYKGTSSFDFCTMQVMTNKCQIESKRGGFKWPKLKEAFKYCFGTELENAHDALADVRACIKIFQWLKSQNDLSVAKL